MLTHDAPMTFAVNRAEEIGYDVWKEFVILPSFDELRIELTQKPRVIVGGRGCGKTMLLRYLSHESAFSPNRKEFPANPVQHIGVYWKADTQFASLLEGRGQQEDVWRAAFGHLAALVLGIEVLRSLKSICGSKLSVLRNNQLSSLDFSTLNPTPGNAVSSYEKLLDYFQSELAQFEDWANDVRSTKQPRFLPGSMFIKRLVLHLQNQLPEIQQSVFSVYIDEYENLSLYQQRMINTWLKHSERPVVFNLAMKRNGFKTRATEGGESLANIHDYRITDLERFNSIEEFSAFAAEILMLRLQQNQQAQFFGMNKLLPALGSSAQIGNRERLKRQVVEAASALFPSPSQQELAVAVFDDTSLLNRLRARVERGLAGRGQDRKYVDALVSSDVPEASIVVPALLCRKSPKLDDIVIEIERLKKGQANRFTGKTDWIHNNFIGCYLQLFDGLVRPCPFFSGLQTYGAMARGNLRHFLELCYRALARSTGGQEVSPETQSEAARQVAAELLAEVRSFGPHGNNLYAFLLRLGTLFSLSQQSPAQSEPERTHFSIREGYGALDGGDEGFLFEAEKWSVISTEKGTKKKIASDLESLEYVLNPIYSPYFHISYRKKRKLEMRASEVTTLISGSYDAVKGLFEAYQQRWLVDLSDASLSLFSHLDEDSANDR